MNTYRINALIIMMFTLILLATSCNSPKTPSINKTVTITPNPAVLNKPVTIHIFAGKNNIQLSLASITIKDASGNSVKTYSLTPFGDDESIPAWSGDGWTIDTTFTSGKPGTWNLMAVPVSNINPTISGSFVVEETKSSANGLTGNIVINPQQDWPIRGSWKLPTSTGETEIIYRESDVAKGTIKVFSSNKSLFMQNLLDDGLTTNAPARITFRSGRIDTAAKAHYLFKPNETITLPIDLKNSTSEFADRDVVKFEFWFSSVTSAQEISDFTNRP